MNVHIGVTGNPIALAQVFMEGGRGECFNIEGDMTSQQISSDVSPYKHFSRTFLMC